MASRRRPNRSRGDAPERAAKTPPASPARTGLPVWLLAAVLVVAGVAAYATSFSGVFMGDDLDAIVSNQNLHALWPLSSAASAPKDTTLAGRPVSTLSFALNYALAPAAGRDIMAPRPNVTPDTAFYDNVWGYHATNLLIHVLAALALFGVIRHTLLTPVLRPKFGGAATALAFGIALIWVVHPLHTDAVTYLVMRVESLMGLWVLTTLYCAIRAAETEFRSAAWTAAAVGACALGMGTKEAMFATPILMAAWIHLFRPDVKLIGAPRWLLAGLAATWVMLAVLLLRDSRSGSVGFLGGWTWWLYLRTQAAVVVHYLRLSFWPHPLVFQYAWLPVSSWMQVLPQFLLLGALGIATVIGFVRRRPVAFLGVVFFLILAPTSSVLPIVSEVAAEHRMYLPLAAVITAIVIGLYASIERLGGTAVETARLRRQSAPAAWVAVVAIAMLLGWQTSDRNRVYASVETMMADNAAARPDNASVQLVYGGQLFRSRQFAEAEAVMRRALELPLPLGTDAHPHAFMELYLGAALCSQRKFDEGMAHLNRAVELVPDLVEAYGYMGEAQLSQGRANDAVGYFERAIAVQPDAVSQLTRAAWILATSSDATVRNGARAVEYAEKAVAITHHADVSSLDTLGAAYAELGQFDKAVATLQAAIDLDAKLGGSVLTELMRRHLALFEGRRPLRTAGW